ncbi:MAG: DUF4389 domain-containing protein [Dehalococcoidia bacterium]
MAADGEARPQPVALSIVYPDQLSRDLNLPLLGIVVKFFLALPAAIIVAVLRPGSLAGLGETVEPLDNAIVAVSVLVFLLYLMGPVGILFTGHYPRPVFDFVVAVQRIDARVTAYLASMTDHYPSPSFEEDPRDAAKLTIAYAEELNRFLNFPIVGFVIKLVLCIPHLLLLIFALVVSFALIFLAQFAILFSGRFPPGMFRFCAGTFQYQYRIFAFIYHLSDRYPPFSFLPDKPQPALDPPPVL